MVNYPGHRRVSDIRARLVRMREDIDDTIEEIAHLRREVAALRAEVGAISTDVGDQLASQASAIESLQHRSGAPERHDP